jgi:hypothetical protein
VLREHDVRAQVLHIAQLLALGLEVVLHAAGAARTRYRPGPRALGGRLGRIGRVDANAFEKIDIDRFADIFRRL